MREILYRAKIAGTDQWVEGLPHTVYGNVIDSIMTFDRRVEYIKTDTLCELTGLTDKNGKKIFEGDIVKHETWAISFSKYISETKEVYFDTELLEFGLKESFALFNCQFSDEFEVIGTIYDNPELLNQ